MIEQTFYKGFEIRRHTFPYNGERRLLGYSVRKTLADGTVVPYRRKSKNRTASYSDIWIETEQEAKAAIDAGEITVNSPRKRKEEEATISFRYTRKKAAK